MQTQKPILVTGGSGFIGTHLCRKLRGRGYPVRVLDLRAPDSPVAGVEYSRGDVRDASRLAPAVEGVQAVYHLAATVSVPLCQNEPLESYSNNFTATVQVLEAVRQASARAPEPIRLVFASTAALYGDRGNDGRALAERDTASEFLSFYAAQKFASENAIALYRNFHGVPAIPFRFFNVFGPGQDPTSPYSGVITVFNRLLREGRPLPLNGGGVQTRDFISVHDLTDACASALGLPASRWDGRPINLGTGSAITVRQLAEVMVKVSGSRSPITVAPPREGDVLHSLADISRAREVLGFKPAWGLQEGLAELLNAGAP